MSQTRPTQNPPGPPCGHRVLLVIDHDGITVIDTAPAQGLLEDLWVGQRMPPSLPRRAGQGPLEWQVRRSGKVPGGIQLVTAWAAQLELDIEDEHVAELHRSGQGIGVDQGSHGSHPHMTDNGEAMTLDAIATPQVATPQVAAPSTPVLAPLRLGRHVIESPVVLAPMAGITNRAFRRICREYGLAGSDAGGACGATSLYVSEMVTSRALVERNAATMRLISHDPGEYPRSVQLYSVDPVTAGRAARILVAEDRADHIDLNFGCPVPKVTRKGGGAALPWKTGLFRSIVAAVVREAAPYDVPVTVKMRVGIDDDHLTYLDAGRIAEAEGAAAVALHARTAAQAYSGHADWSAIAALKDAVTSIPVLGNGDLWSAEDALAMVASTGCDGVVIGRGCLGRPWLFTDLAAAFAGSHRRVKPDLREVTGVLRRHAAHLVEFYDGDELRGCRDIRKHIAWYLKGFPAGSDVRHRLALVDSLAALDDLIATMDLDARWPGAAAEGPRGRAGAPRAVALPERWLDCRDLDDAQQGLVAQAELDVSGG